MIRTTVAVAILFAATFLLPFWVQLCLYLLAVLLVSYRAVLIIPALFADAWYAPIRNLSIANNKTTLIVIGLILLYVLVIRKTRVGVHYGLPKA